MVNFHTVNVSLRYGLTERVNVGASLPYLSIQSDKFQGAEYSRVNRGLGDLTLMADVVVWAVPQVTVEGGVKLATGSVDNKDDLGQRICDILALGSGTNDLIVGTGVWWAHAGLEHLDLMAGVNHRFSGGENKWGYRFGDQTSFFAHANHPVGERARLGLRFQGFHADRDTWYGNVVPERGATMLYAGPTASWQAGSVTLGAFARFPLLMSLEGSQMVAPSVIGFELSTDITSAMQTMFRPLGGEL